MSQKQLFVPICWRSKITKTVVLNLLNLYFALTAPKTKPIAPQPEPTTPPISSIHIYINENYVTHQTVHTHTPPLTALTAPTAPQIAPTALQTPSITPQTSLIAPQTSYTAPARGEIHCRGELFGGSGSWRSSRDAGWPRGGGGRGWSLGWRRGPAGTTTCTI